ncbi:MAG TPA: inositol monophosphatase family protein [Terriglobia bacterium]|nr:inositol monophosphatase family protein [Terriglobia bacterium]
MSHTEDRLTTAIDLARRAGAVLRGYVGREKGIEYKGRANLVTRADKESEALILAGIRDRFPEDAILAEESGAVGVSSATRWIVDPLDGTTNFAHQYPAYTVSIGVEMDGTVVCGVVYEPLRDELFSAARGKGSFLNGERLQVSNVNRLAEGLLITGFPYDFRDRLDRVLAQFRGFLTEAQAVRRGGSAALDLCYLAAGRCDGFWELGLHPWDTAAGTLIAAEAGARITDFEGRPFSIDMREILASNGRIHEEMAAIVRNLN